MTRSKSANHAYLCHEPRPSLLSATLTCVVSHAYLCHEQTLARQLVVPAAVGKGFKRDVDKRVFAGDAQTTGKRGQEAIVDGEGDVMDDVGIPGGRRQTNLSFHCKLLMHTAVQGKARRYICAYVKRRWQKS